MPELLPRLCHLVKGENGYGFNLHSDKTKGGQFVRAVDADSPAESAGIRAGDRVVEVRLKVIKINGECGVLLGLTSEGGGERGALYQSVCPMV